jgi:serine/threonine protein kinase
MPLHPDFEETRLFGDAPGAPGSAPAGSTCAIGDLLAGRFRIIRFIARGGMGELYEAEDLELRERVALKAMRPEIAADEDANRRFRREVQLARQVTHPNICRIFDLFQHQPPGPRPPVVFVTMELLEGDTLAERLQREGKFTVDAAQPLVAQMAAALDSAHRLGIVHRDFKSSNVMLLDPHAPGAPPRVVVTDFGIAYRVGEISPASVAASTAVEILGTPDYMAPEQLDGHEVTASTDIYALGVVMYEMVTGTRPFAAASPTAAGLRAIRETPPSPRDRVPDLPLAWEMTILRCLSRRPEDRFSDVQSVLDALGVESDRAPVGLRQMAVVVGVAAVAITLVTALGIYVSGDRSGETSAPDRSAASTLPPRRSIAVLGFRNVSGRQDEMWLSTAFAEMLTTELAAGEALRTIPSDNVHRMKTELAILDADSYAGDTLSLIRTNLSADLVVFGSYVAVGQGDRSVRLDVRVQDAKVGQMIAQVSETGPESDLLAMVSRVGHALRERLGVRPLTAGAVQAVRALQPANPEAARLYAEGLSRLRRFDAQAARDLFEKAAAAYPRFPLPHSALAMTWSTLGHDSRARDAARRAYELSPGLSREDKLIVEATYRAMTGDWKEAVELNRTLATFFPDNIEYALRLANAEISAGAPREGLATIEALRAQRPPARPRMASVAHRGRARHSSR